MRSCSYCGSVEHDRRKCSHHQSDKVLLYDIVSLYVNVVLDSLTYHGIGPTALLSVSDSGFHFYKNNPEADKFIWTKIESETPELFAVDRIDLVELAPFGIPGMSNSTYHRRDTYHITMTHLESSSRNMLKDSARPPQYTKVHRNMRRWLWTIPCEELMNSIQSLETVLWRESYGTKRKDFVDILKNLRSELEKFRYKKKYFKTMKDVVVLSGIPSETLELFYETKKQKIIKSSLDKTLESWYKYYSKKIKHNHF